MLDEQQFKLYCDRELDFLSRALMRAGEEFEFDTDLNAGALTVEFEAPPAKFVVSPNAPVRQIWISAHSRSFKLDWDPEIEAFVLPGTKRTLLEVMAQHVSEHLGETVTL